MTLTDTLDHLLSVFLRPLRTWIEREFVAPLRAAYDAAMQTKEQYRDGVYLHLKERLEGTEEHPLAEGVPVRPLPAVQDLEHLQESVELLDTRKIDTGSLTDGVPDGVSLVRLLCDSSLASQVTEIVDTNKPYSSNATFPFGNLPYLERVVLNFNKVRNNIPIANSNSLKDITIPYLKEIKNEGNTVTFFSGTSLRRIYMPSLENITVSNANAGFTFDNITSPCEIVAPNLSHLSGGSSHPALFKNVKGLRKFIIGKLTYCVLGSSESTTSNLIHIEIGDTTDCNMDVRYWSPSMSLRTDTTASDYIDLREDKDDRGEFINATNLEQFLANFRKYIILRVANRTGQTALTLTLSAAVYQSIYGLDSSNNADNNSWARTHTLSDLGLTADDLTEAETAAGITINTIYATWLDTYRSAINWNIGH